MNALRRLIKPIRSSIDIITFINRWFENRKAKQKRKEMKQSNLGQSIVKTIYERVPSSGFSYAQKNKERTTIFDVFISLSNENVMNSNRIFLVTLFVVIIHCGSLCSRNVYVGREREKEKNKRQKNVGSHKMGYFIDSTSSVLSASRNRAKGKKVSSLFFRIESIHGKGEKKKRQRKIKETKNRK